MTTNHNLALSGGTDKSNYRFSVGYLYQQGVAINNDIQRINGRLNFNQKALNDHLELKFAINALQSDNSPMDKSNFAWAYGLLPVYPVKNDDGNWYDLPGMGLSNPVQNIAYNSSLHKNTVLITNMRAVITILKGFTADINLFKQREMDDYGLYYDSRTQPGYADQGFAQRSNYTNDKNLLEFTLNYIKKIGDHNLTILGGYSYEDNYYQNSGAQNRQFITDQFNYNSLRSGENLRDGDVWSGKSMNKLISFFGRLNYNFKEKYLLTATLRQDGSSKFGENYKWGVFPSVSAAWHLSSEPFMSGIKAISDLKLRVGYGVNGNQDAIPPYTSLALYGPSAVKYYDDGKYYTAYKYAQNPNPDLKWEQTAMTNLGIDFSLFSGRVRGTLDFYYKKTSNLLYNYPVPMPPYLYPTILANVGSISNKGFEFMIDVDPVQTSDLKWTISVSFAMNRNKILELSNEEFSTSSVYTGYVLAPGISTTTQILEEGKAVGTFYGWKCLGLDKNGMFILQVKDSLAGPTAEDRTYIGSAQPIFTYGIQNTITYKRFELNFFLRGVYGNDVLNSTRMTYATTLRLPGANVLKEALTNGMNDTPNYNSYYIEKGSFLRLDNASLSYDFNTKSFWGIEKLRINCTVQNLFVITRYKGVDPEVDMSGIAPGMQGADYYPKSRTFLLGINLKF